MTKKTQIQVKSVPLGKLIPYVNNARSHTATQVAQIAASIKEFGFNNPILVDGDNGVIAGHGRLQAARMLEMTEVPVIELSHLTPNEKRAYILADNKLGDNSSFDYEILQVELDALKDDDFNIAVLGFDDFEIMSMDSDFSMDSDGSGDSPPMEGEEGFEPAHYSVSYTVIFTDEDEQKRWHQYLKKLKADYPDIETISGRLLTDIEKHHG